MKNNCKLAGILDFSVCAELVKNCPADEVVILCPHYSINIASRYDDGEELDWDLDELSDAIGVMVEVNDYDDLVADPHGLITI